MPAMKSIRPQDELLHHKKKSLSLQKIATQTNRRFLFFFRVHVFDVILQTAKVIHFCHLVDKHNNACAAELNRINTNFIGILY